jgi:amino acid adenylation domain-containing protein/non-ribosomal peptide synthase protein (TIGR01720 family)
LRKDLADRLAALSPAQQALINLRLKKKSAGEAATTIPKRKQQNHCPLSLDQERLWFIQQLDPSSAAYNIYTAVRFHGTVKAPVLTRALNEIVQRHEIMRTSFAAPNGAPVQIIAPHLEVRIPLIDLRVIPAAGREREANRLAAEVVSRPFDLAELPLFRTLLLQVGDEDFICPSVFHHIITDWVAFHTFDHELAQLYAAFLEGRPSPLEPLPIQYADFAVWQREWLSGDILAAQIDYWRSHLKGAPPLLELPTDRPRPPVQTPNGLRQPLALSKEHSDFVRATANRHEVTLFIALLALFKILLFRLTGHARIVVGSPIANRSQPELQNLLGFFINHLVFCTGISGDLFFGDFLKQVREVALQAYANQDVPFGRLVDELGLERNLGRTPLTQVVLLFLNPLQQGEIRFSGLRILPYTVDSESSKFDMTFSLWDSPEAFSGWFEYNTDLFDRTTILRMGEQFRTLLAALAANPQQRIADLPLLSKGERQQVLREWNDTVRACPSQTVIEQVEENARLRGDMPAVSDGHIALTYAELNRRANRLARRLVCEGIGPEVKVGVFLERGVDMVVAWLAVGKAGGAYVPVGEGTPRARWEGMLSAAEARLLISKRNLAQAYTGRAVWIEDEDDVDENEENLGVRLEPENLAYVIFTSGSSGQPKGVAVEHRGLSNLVEWHKHGYGVGPGDRASQVANLGFDAAAWEIWPYLAAGASVAIADEGIRNSPSELVAWLQKEQVSHCFLPTPIAEVALEEKWDGGRLRVLLTGGDRLRKRPGAELPCELWNHYGPTETTVVGTWSKVEQHGQELPDIGLPIDNLRAYVLDELQGLVAVGVTGELYLGGVGLARGYVGDPEETAEKFVPDCFSGERGARLYRTGDLARWGRNGRLIYAGRQDQQIKLRGYRIEPGEIEAQLCELPGVKAAAVIIVGEADLRHLAGYVTGERLQPERLRAQLRERLPDYMVPASLRVLDALPLTSNGKIDRTELAKIEVLAVSPVGLVAPRTSAEIALARIWCEVLGRKEIGIEDNFFQLGGDSILSIQIVARARQAGLRLAPRQIFEHQTITHLAAVAQPMNQVAAEEDPIYGPTPLTPIQLWFLEQDITDAHHFNQAVLLHTKDLSFAVLENVIRKMQMHHDALRMRFHPVSGHWEAETVASTVASEASPVVFVNLGELEGGLQRSTLESAASALQRSLHLQRGPLFRVALFDCGPQQQRLLMVAHHLVVDGVSWRILLEDLETGCRQATQGEAIQFPAKTTSFQRWAGHLRDHAQQQELRTEGEWWAASLPAHAPSLPLDSDLGDNTVEACSFMEISLSPEQTQAVLDQSGPQYRMSVSEVLLTALLESIAEWTGASCLLVDVEGHGREEIFPDLDLSRTVGWFTSLYPVAVDFSGTKNSIERLKLVKNQVRAIPRHGIGYGVLRYLAGANCNFLRALPEAQIVFNYLGRLDLVVRNDSLFQPASEDCGNTRSPKGRRRYLWEIDAGVIGDRLQVRWNYCCNAHQPTTMEKLASGFSTSISRLLSDRVPGDSLTLTDSVANLDGTHLAAGSYRILPPVRPAMRHVDPPLSYAQEQIWLVDKMVPGNAFFNFSSGIRVQGELNCAALEASFAEIIRRHEVLRVSFAESDRGPVQRVRNMLFKMPTVDLSELAEEGRELEARQLATTATRRAFDTSREPLLRVLCLRMGKNDYRICITIHHVATDGWSLGIFVRELKQLYGAYSHGEPSPLPPLSIQYGDFAVWEREQIVQGRFAEQLQYWLEQMKGDLQPLELPLDAARGEPAFVVARENFPIEADLCGDLREFSSNHGVSLFMTLLSGFALVVANHSGQDDFRIGTLVGGRNRPELEDLIGLFVNTLLLRLRVPPSATFQELLGHTREVVLEAFQHQDLPFELLIQALEQERAVDRAGLCQVLFIMQNPSMAALELPGLRVSVVEHRTQAHLEIYPTSFDLIVNTAEDAGALRITITYKATLFRRETICRLAEDWQAILRQMTVDMSAATQRN